MAISAACTLRGKIFPPLTHIRKRLGTPGLVKPGGAPQKENRRPVGEGRPAKYCCYFAVAFFGGVFWLPTVRTFSRRHPPTVGPLPYTVRPTEVSKKWGGNPLGKGVPQKMVWVSIKVWCEA